MKARIKMIPNELNLKSPIIKKISNIVFETIHNTFICSNRNGKYIVSYSLFAKSNLNKSLDIMYTGVNINSVELTRYIYEGNHCILVDRECVTIEKLNQAILNKISWLY